MIEFVVSGAEGPVAVAQTGEISISQRGAAFGGAPGDDNRVRSLRAALPICPAQRVRPVLADRPRSSQTANRWCHVVDRDAGRGAGRARVVVGDADGTHV